MSSIDETIGRRLRALREAAGCTLDQLAEHLSLAADELGQIEEGKVRMGPDLMTLACRILAVSPTYFFHDVLVSSEKQDSDDPDDPDGSEGIIRFRN